ncbi:MAG: methyltransferase domain-containing protein [Deltaproteobacteria bacterium]|nr:methyltransferase domain-containing protein [Deltaproteobacteria bacterium]
MQTDNQVVHTEGTVLHWAGFYDLLLKIVTLGREGRFRRRIITTARLESGQRVLDVGCGTGTLAVAAAEVVGTEGSVHGIDPAPEMIARARAKAEKAAASVAFEVGVIEALAFPDQSMDVVLSSLMFHHLTDQLKPLGLAEIRRVLAPGGRLVVVDFGKPDGMVAEVKAAGFGTVTTARFGPRFLFSLIAEAGAVGSE